MDCILLNVQYMLACWNRVISGIYYYDNEIAMYYLQSRYYDPQTGRFINADNLLILGILFLINHITLGNLFSYCGNAPVADKDIAGAISEHDLSALLDPLSVFEKFVTSLYQDLKNGLLLVGAYATKILSPIAVKALWWKPIVAIALVALAVALVVIAVSAVYNAKIAKKKGKTPIPSQLKNGSKVKTPTSHKGEFSNKKRGKYTHKKTKWKFEKSKDGHYNGEHWHAYPENAQTGDYYNISPDGRVLS